MIERNKIIKIDIIRWFFLKNIACNLGSDSDGDVLQAIDILKKLM